MLLYYLKIVFPIIFQKLLFIKHIIIKIKNKEYKYIHTYIFTDVSHCMYICMHLLYIFANGIDRFLELLAQMHLNSMCVFIYICMYVYVVVCRHFVYSIRNHR